MSLNYFTPKTKYQLVKWLNWFYEFKEHPSFFRKKKKQLQAIYFNLRNKNETRTTPLRRLSK